MDLIDLKENGLKIVTNGDQIRKGIIPSVTVRHFAERYGCIAAINGGPFDPVSAQEGEERELVGLFISEGKMIQRPDPRYDAILFYEDGGAVIKNQGEINNMPVIEIERITTAVGGFYTALSDGIVPPQRNNLRHPRSAVGLSSDGSKLFFLVIDGRRLQSVGATMSETGEILLRLGAASGLNLDGGGSSALILRQNGKPSPLNIPIHGGLPGRERAVASCLGISRR
ncbi:hypothetical protein AGMMS50212_09350 [Spirochaetia bacterium]|nr:hypothetical protein AGMMS50212_09350 [Spirochaetia bacterium]